MFTRFTSDDLEKLCGVLETVVAMPVHGEVSPFILPTDASLTQLQEGVLHSIDLLITVKFSLLSILKKIHMFSIFLVSFKL